jgi:hypothetical protein
MGVASTLDFGQASPMYSFLWSDLAIHPSGKVNASVQNFKLNPPALLSLGMANKQKVLLVITGKTILQL